MTSKDQFLAIAGELLALSKAKDWPSVYHARAIALLARRTLPKEIRESYQDALGHWVVELTTALSEGCWLYASNGKKLLQEEQLIPANPKVSDVPDALE